MVSDPTVGLQVKGTWFVFAYGDASVHGATLGSCELVFDVGNGSDDRGAWVEVQQRINVVLHDIVEHGVLRVVHRGESRRRTARSTRSERGGVSAQFLKDGVLVVLEK